MYAILVIMMVWNGIAVSQSDPMPGYMCQNAANSYNTQMTEFEKFGNADSAAICIVVEE